MHLTLCHIYLAPFCFLCEILYALVLYHLCPFIDLGMGALEVCFRVRTLERIKRGLFFKVYLSPDK